MASSAFSVAVGLMAPLIFGDLDDDVIKGDLESWDIAQCQSWIYALFLG